MRVGGNLVLVLGQGAIVSKVALVFRGVLARVRNLREVNAAWAHRGHR